MIRFSARGAYLLLVPQRRALIRGKAVIRDRALIKDRALTDISFLEKAEWAKQSFDDFTWRESRRLEKDLLSLDPSWLERPA